MARSELTRGDLWLLTTVLAGFAVADAAVLTAQWYAPGSGAWCDLGTYFSCSRVRESPFASVGGVPVAAMALVGFALLLGLAVAGLFGRGTAGPLRVSRALFLLAAAGTVIGIALTAIEVFVIRSVCVLCAIGFGLDLGILAIAVSLDRGSAR
jgi:uncharacterized membrane protein